MAMFSLKILTVESYQSSPISGYDECYSEFRGCEIFKVPTITIFGTTPAGQKGAIHVHGVFPYLYLRWKDVYPDESPANGRKLLQNLALDIDRLLNIEAVKSSSNRHHVHNITIEKKRSIYGFHAELDDYIKIRCYYPWDTSKLAALLYNGRILDKFLQPYEAHFPYTFQFLIDYNLAGMNNVNLSSDFKFRTPIDFKASPSRTSQGYLDFLSEDSPSFSKIWNVASLSSSQVNNIPKKTVSLLELDCHEDAIMNKYKISSFIGKNPGLAIIAEDLKQQRRLANEASQMTPIKTLERDIEVTPSEQYYKELMKKVLEKKEAAENYLKHEDDESDIVDGSQRSFVPSSSESFNLSTTQDKEMLKLFMNLWEDHGPDEDSILALKNDSESDEDEVTNEMSQRFTDNILNTHLSSEKSSSSDHSIQGFLDSAKIEMKSESQQGCHIPQVDGAYDDENFENGPRLLKQETVNLNTEFNEEPPVLHPVHSLESLEVEPDWIKQCSVKVTDIGTVDSSRPVPLADLANGSIVRPKSKKLHVPVVKKSDLSKTMQSEQTQKKNLTVDSSVKNVLNDLISTVVEQESESRSSCSNNKTAKLITNADSFLGARPKTKKFTHSPPDKSSCTLKKSVDTVSANDSKSQASKSASGNDLSKISEQKQIIDSTCVASISKHSIKHRSKVKNGEFEIHPKLDSNAQCIDKKKNLKLHTSSSKRKSSKKSTSSEEILTGVNSKSKKSKTYKLDEKLSKSSVLPDALKKACNDHDEFQLSSDQSPIIKSPDSIPTFHTLKPIQGINFSNFGNEAVVLKKLTEKDIEEYNQGKLSVKNIPEQAFIENKKDDPTVVDKNKSESASLNKVNNWNLKETLKMKPDFNSCKKHAYLEKPIKSVKNSKKNCADSQYSSLIQISNAKDVCGNIDSKKSKNLSHCLNNLPKKFNTTKISEKKKSDFTKNYLNPLLNNGMSAFESDIHRYEPIATNLHQSTMSLINVAELDDMIYDVHSVSDSDVRNQENITKSLESVSSSSSLTASIFTSDMKPQFQKSLKNSDRKTNSKHKHSKKDKNSPKEKDKKMKSSNHSDKKLNGKYSLFKSLEYDNDFKKVSKADFKNSLHERNIDYFPKAKAMSPGLKPQIHSLVKMLGREPNQDSDVAKPGAMDSSPKSTVFNNKQNFLDKINKIFGNIIENSPYVKLVDCKKLIEKYYPENMSFLSKKNMSNQSKKHRKLGSSKSFSDSLIKKPNVPRKEDIFSSTTGSIKNQVKRLTNNVQKPKNSQLSGSSTSKRKIHEYPKLDLHPLPFAVKSKPYKSSDGVLPILDQSKSIAYSELKAQSCPSGVLNTKTDNKGFLPFAVKSKPLPKLGSSTDLHTKNEQTGRSENQNINLHANYASCELTPTKIASRATENKSSKNTENKSSKNTENKSSKNTENKSSKGIENKSSSKSNDSSFSDCNANPSKKPSSSKNSKCRFNNKKLNKPDCVIMGDIKTSDTVETKIPNETKESHNKKKVRSPSPFDKNEDNHFKASLENAHLKNGSLKFNVMANEQKDTMLEEITKMKPARENRCKPKLNLGCSFDNDVITTNDLYDTVKRRTANKNQLALKSDSSRPVSNNKSGKAVPASSKTKTTKKGPTSCQNNISPVLSTKSDAKSPSIGEKDISFSLSEEKNSSCASEEKIVPVEENSDSVLKSEKPISSEEKIAPVEENSDSVLKSEKQFSSQSENQSHIKQGVLIPNNRTTDNSSMEDLSKVAKDATAQNEIQPKSPVPSTSKDFLHSDIPSINNACIHVADVSNGNDTGLLPHSVSACGNGSSKNILSRPSKRKASKISGTSNNFGFFSSKTPQRNRRCQNDPESSQFAKPMSSRLSLKLNKKNEITSEKTDSISQQDSRPKWKIDSMLVENGISQSTPKLTSSETNSKQQTPEKFVLPTNITIKIEPPDDYEDINKNSDISDALKCFDFDESSSSDPASYTFNQSKQARIQKPTKDRQMPPQSRHLRNSAKNQSCNQQSSIGCNEGNKTDFHTNTSCNNNPTKERYPKRNRSVSSIIDDDVVILDETPSSSTSRRTRRSSRFMSNNNTAPKEVIDLENEDTSKNVAPVITIKRDSEGNNSIVPNKRCTAFVNNVNKLESLTDSQPSTSSSSCNSASNSSDNLGSVNSSENLLSSPDSKHGLKMILHVKRIVTRNNEPKIVVVGKQLNGENDEENYSNVQNNCEVAVKTEEVFERKSSKTKRTLGVRSSKRKSKMNTDTQYVPPLLIKNIKKEKCDDYEMPYVQPLKFTISSINTGETERPSTSVESKCEPLKLLRRLNNFYVDDTSNKRKLSNTSEGNSDNGTEVPPKRRRGRPAKVQKCGPPKDDLSTLQNNTSFDVSLNGLCSTPQIPRISAADQQLDIRRRCSFPISDNIEACSFEKVGPGLKFDWVKVKIKQEPLSDNEGDCKVDNNINNNSISPLMSNASATTSKRRNSMRCENFTKYFDSGSDDDVKIKKESKPQKKKTRSKSDNTEAIIKTVEQAREMPFSNRRTKTRLGSFKEYLNSGKGGNSSDSDCKVVGTNIASTSKKAPRRKRGRPPLSRNRQMALDPLPSCNPCSVTLERLSPTLLKQGSSTKKTRKISSAEANNMLNLNPDLDDGIQIVPEVNSNTVPDCSTQNSASAIVISASFGNDSNNINQQSLNSEKSDFEVLHNKVMGEKISPVLQSFPDKNPCNKFILDSGPVTINGLNSIDIDSNFSELLCEKEIPENKMSCSSFMFNSSLNADNNILSNRNSANFLRPPSHEMDQRVFESPSNILKSGSMDCQSPLLYSHSPITDAKHVSEFSPDNKFMHLNHSSPQAYKRHQDLIHSPIVNSDPALDRCSSPLKEVTISSHKNENLKSPDKDFNRTASRQQSDVTNYYASSSDSCNEGSRTDPSVIGKSKTRGKMYSSDSFHGNDFCKGQQQHSSPYSFENSSLEQNRELSFCVTKGYGNYDKISTNQQQYLGNNLSGRKESMTCFPNNYSESRKLLPASDPTRSGGEGQNQEDLHYSRFPSSYGSPVGVQQQQQSFSAHNQNSFNNSYHQRTDESLNSFRSSNDYYERMKWGKMNADGCKSQFSAQENKYDSYYAKNGNDLSRSTRRNNDPYYRQKWAEANTSYYHHNDRSLTEFSQNDRTLNEYSLSDRPVNDTFMCQPSEVQAVSSKYDNSYPNINSQVSGPVSTSSGVFDRTKSADVSFSNFECDPSEPKEFQDTLGKKFENAFDKNMEAFFNNGYSSTSSEIQSPSPVSHSSPLIATSPSPFRAESKIGYNKKMDFNYESSDASRKYIDVCKPSPCSSLSDHLDSVQSPSFTNKSPLCIPNRPASVVEEFNKVQEIMEELSSPCQEKGSEPRSTPEQDDKNSQSPDNAREVLALSSDSGDTRSECTTIQKSPPSKNAKTSTNECEQDVESFEMTLDSVQEDSFDLLSEQMISEDESFLIDDNIFPSSPQKEIDDSSPTSVCGNDFVNSHNIPKATPAENSSVQNTEADQTSLNYSDCDVQILNFQECLTESDPVMHPFLADLSFDFLSQDSNSITNKENDGNVSVAATDVSVKDNLSESAQIAIKTEKNNGCPLFIETVPNVNVIMTNPSSSISELPNSFVPLESLKNSVMPVLTVSNSTVNEAVCYTQPSTSTTFNPTLLSTVMVNDSLVLPQSNFFFNNASIIVGEGSSVEQDCINMFHNSNTDKNYSIPNVSAGNSKLSQEVQNLKKSFNGEDDILSMIVKSCDIGAEFDENFNSPGDSVNTNAEESSIILSATESLDGSSNLNTSLEINSTSGSFPVNSFEKISLSSQDLPSSSGQKVESTVMSSLTVSPSNHSLESSQDRDDIQPSAPLDSMVHSFYGDDTLYGLNASGNCDSPSVCSNFLVYNVSIGDINASNKNIPKSNANDFPERYDKSVVTNSSQSCGLPSSSNSVFASEQERNRQSPLNSNKKFEAKKAAGSFSDETQEGDSKNNICQNKFSPSPNGKIAFCVDPNPKLSILETSSSQKNEFTQVQSQPSSPCDYLLAKNTPSTLKRQKLSSKPNSKGNHEVLRDLLSKKNTVWASTPSANRKTQLPEQFCVSPISKNNLLTNDTKKKRKLFDDTLEQNELQVRRLKKMNKKSWQKSFIADQSKDFDGSVNSEIDGPTLLNSRDFRIASEDCGRVRNEVQHLTIMSLEIHVNTRNILRPDPSQDPVAVIFYSIYNQIETCEQKIVGIIALDVKYEKSGLRNTRSSLKNYLSLAPGVKTCCVTCVEDENLLFEELKNVVREWDPDVLVGYDIHKASWGYLFERAKFIKINLTSMLSRFISEKKESNVEQIKEDPLVTDQTADIDGIKIPGRPVLNVWRLMRNEITLNVYTFENVYYHVLHKRTPKHDFHHLTQWFCSEPKEAVVRYYVTRILGTVEILDHLNFFGLKSEMARVYGIQLYEVLSRGSQFRVESMLLRSAGPMGYVPVSPSVEQRSHQRAPECVPLILEPVSKFYEDPVVVLDFQSLYPSIIIAYNYCFSTCLGRIQHFGKDVPFEFGCTSLSVPTNLLQKLSEEDNINFSPQGIAFVKSNVRRGVLPTMLEEILDTRVMVKQSMKKIKDNNSLKKMLDARQLSLKLIANVTYGYTGASYSGRMPCVEVADSIVGKARETLERAKLLIESTPEWRAEVVYGDTDSLFVLLRGRTREEAFKIGYDMADAVTKTNPSPVKLKFEKVYMPCVLQTKKRYVGFMYETVDQETPIFEAKGIETVRRDSCPATAKILEKSLKILFQTKNVNSVKMYVQKQFRKIMKGRINLMDFIFAKEYRGLSGYKPGACVPALEIAKRRLKKDPRSEPNTGERVPYVVVYDLPGLPIIRLIREPGDILLNPSLRINAAYYITRVISPPLERVFSLMGVDVKTWYTAIAHTQTFNLPMYNQPRETITQYFITRNCPSCEFPTSSVLCDNCRQDRAGTVANLQDKIRNWERSVNHLHQICETCTKTNSSVDRCTSMDCPILFKLNLAKKDFSQAPYLRKILTHELF